MIKYIEDNYFRYLWTREGSGAIWTGSSTQLMGSNICTGQSYYNLARAILICTGQSYYNLTKAILYCGNTRLPSFMEG